MLVCMPAAGARMRKPPPPLLLPSPLIEDRIQEEVEDALFLLENLNAGNLLDSGYLVSAIYYHDGLFRSFPKDRRDGDPTTRATALIMTSMTLDRKAKFIDLLHATYADRVEQLPDNGSLPLLASERQRTKRRRRRSPHQNALDLFAAEGTPVRSMTRGVVVLADSDWQEGDPMSSTSDRGGNAVIVFDPATDRFYRYCHMSAVLVEAGGLVAPGQTIGLVGHTGRNASRPGHGRHLHFEVNEYRDGVTKALTTAELKELIRAYSITANARTGKVPNPLIFTGTALNRKPDSGNDDRLHRCSQTGMPAPSRMVCAGRARSDRSSTLCESMPTSRAPAATSASAASRLRYGWSSKYLAVRQCRSQPV
jgi:hypothetical protein